MIEEGLVDETVPGGEAAVGPADALRAELEWHSGY